MHPNDAPLPDALVERVLARLGLDARPACGLDGLAQVYEAWSLSVPFDNVRKLVHLSSGDARALAGDEVTDFLEAWLEHGSGGTCWAGNGALCSLLQALGFRARRAVATMMVAPNLPPNHGSVVVEVDGADWLVDASMLYGAPLRLDAGKETAVVHPARGVRCAVRDGKWHVAWRPLHMADGLECRLDALEATSEEFSARHEQTRAWSPFNFEVNARRNRGDSVVGLAFGSRVEIDATGRRIATPLDQEGRRRVLVEEVGISPGLVDRLPPDRPTPPPPGSATHATAHAAPVNPPGRSNP